MSDEFKSLATRQRDALDYMGVCLARDECTGTDVEVWWRDTGETACGETVTAALAELLGISRVEAHDLLARIMAAQREGDIGEGTTAYQLNELREQLAAAYWNTIDHLRVLVGWWR